MTPESNSTSTNLQRLLLLSTAAAVTTALWWPEPPPVVAEVEASPHRIPPVPAAAPRHRTGALAGLVVHLSPGHGYVAHPNGFGWQRPHIHGLLEDTWTATFATDHLIPALERAGALVLTPRERDRNVTMVVADDLDLAFEAEGVRRRDIGSSWAAEQPTRRLSESLGGSTLLEPDGRALWRLTAPHDGAWQLYATWLAGPDRDHEARYTVRWPGGSEVFTVDQTARGEVWWPLSRIDVLEGDEVEVYLHGSGSGTLSANAVRMGGGTHRVEDLRTLQLLELPAWQVASIHHLRVSGAPPEIWGGGGGGFAGDASTRARWANWLHDEGDEAVYLSLHTDGGGGTGTTTYIRKRCWSPSCDERVARSEQLADLVRSAIVETIRERFDADWVDRGTQTARLAEVNDELNPAMPAALLEVGFHDHMGDAAILADPGFREAAAEAITHALVRYRNGPDADLPPTTVAEAEWSGQIAWRDDPVASGWRVRESRGANAWTAPAWSLQPRWDPGPGVDRIEVTPVNLAGAGPSTIVELPRDGLVESP